MSLDLLQTLLANVWSIVLVVVFFSASIFVHELGHFLAARWRGAKVERLSIGFGPALWSFRGRDGVEYRLAWFPLGGYVLLPQLADLGPIEGRSEFDTASLPPVNYPTKMIVFVAGALFNVLFAFGLASIIWVIGQPESQEAASTRIGYVNATFEVPGGAPVISPAREAGLRIGDDIKAIDGHPVSKWVDVSSLIGLGAGHSADGRRQAIFTIERAGRTMDIVVHPRLVGEEQDRRVGIGQSYRLSVLQVSPGSLAAKAGFRADDTILAIDGTPVFNANTYVDLLEASAKRAVSVQVRRAGQDLTLTIPARPAAKSGAVLGLALTTGFTLIYPTPWAQISEQVTMSFRTLWSLLNPHSDIGLSKLTGPVGIVRIFHSAAEAGIRPVLMFTILLNMSLAIFNLLPIPILDGGQMLFATIGRLRGRALPVNFVIVTQSACGVLLLMTVLYVMVFGDIRRWINDARAEHAEAPPPHAAPAKP